MSEHQCSSQSDDQSDGERNEPDYQRRHRYSRQELDELNASYARNPRPSKEERERLARFCGVVESKIQIWFQNRRAKDRRSVESLTLQHSQPSSSNASPSADTTSSPLSTSTNQTNTSQTSTSLRRRRQAAVILSHEPTPPDNHDRGGLRHRRMNGC